MVRVLEGSGRVGVGVDGGRSMEGPEVMVRVLEGSGRVGVGVDGGRSIEGPEVMVRVGGVGGRGEMVGDEGGATGVADLELMEKSIWSASLMDISSVESTVTMFPSLLLISELSVSNWGEGDLEPE